MSNSRPTAGGGRATNPWLVCFNPQPSARLRLFCFSYAGGSAHAYRQWAGGLPSGLEILSIQLPGRGARLFEPLYTSLSSAVDNIGRELSPYLDKPFVFFGHSMGALVSFETARYLRARGLPRPLHLFVSGRGGPRGRDRDVNLSTLPDDELVERLRTFNGATADLLDNAELMRMMLPTIRADFQICETYAYRAVPPLDCPISAFGGLDDFDVSRDRLETWQDETTKGFRLRMFPGGHFYLHSSESMLLRALESELAQYLRPTV